MAAARVNRHALGEHRRGGSHYSTVTESIRCGWLRRPSVRARVAVNGNSILRPSCDAVDESPLCPQNASMGVRVMSWLWRPRLLRMLFSQVRLTGRLLREPRVPLLAKVVPVMAALYLVSPLDFIPDLFPLVGQLDDVTLSLIALATFLKMCPEGPVEFHRGAVAQGRPYSPMSPTDDVIDAEWRRD